jgi:5-methyltetrahydrofolate--homocysteine methyltransferase
MADLDALTAAVEAGDRKQAVALVKQAIDDGMAPGTILDAMKRAMDSVGARFQAGELFIPEMLISARAMKEGVALLEPLLVAADVKSEGKAVIGTVKGDLHDIGKNLVGIMLRSANLDVVDLGTNVSPEQFVAAAKEHNAKIVGVSALLTTTMVNMKDVVRAVREADLPGTMVIIGGAPVTKQYADQIGADGYAPDAGSAVDMVRGLLAAAV